jgi:hypothetical protein
LIPPIDNIIEERFLIVRVGPLGVSSTSLPLELFATCPSLYSGIISHYLPFPLLLLL